MPKKSRSPKRLESDSAAEFFFSERTRFVLSPDKWREFNAALNSPPRELPALRRLLLREPFRRFL